MMCGSMCGTLFRYKTEAGRGGEGQEDGDGRKAVTRCFASGRAFMWDNISHVRTDHDLAHVDPDVLL